MTDTPTPPTNPFADSLDFIAQSAAGAAIHAEIVQRYAEAGNVPGLRFAVRCMVAHIRACRGGMQAIDAVVERQAVRASEVS